MAERPPPPVPEAESVRERREASAQVAEIAERLSGMFANGICGISNQMTHHKPLFDIVEQDFLREEKLSLKEIYEMQLALQAVHQNMVHMLSPSITPLGTALKEMNTLLHIGIERKNVANTVNAVMKLCEAMGIKDRHADAFKEHKLYSSSVLLKTMAQDVNDLPEVFRAKVADLRTLDPNLTGKVEEAQRVYRASCETAANRLYALDVEYLSVGFTRFLHDKIVTEESRMKPEFLKLGPVLESGGFGEMRKATMFDHVAQGGRLVRAQGIKYKEEVFKSEYTTLMNEIAFWDNFPPRFHYILKFEGLCLKDDMLYLVTPLASISLEDLLHKEKKVLPPKEVQVIARDVSLALMQLHSLGIIHRNLNPTNLHMLRGSVQVANFGLGFCKYYQHHEGLSPYFAPEVFENDSAVSFATDVYAFGLVMWELNQKDLRPFEDEKYFLYDTVVVNDQRPSLDSGALPQLMWMRALVSRCWQKEAHKRPLSGTVAEIIYSATEQVLKDRPPLGQSDIYREQNKEYFEVDEREFGVVPRPVAPTPPPQEGRRPPPPQPEGYAERKNEGRQSFTVMNNTVGMASLPRPNSPGGMMPTVDEFIERVRGMPEYSEHKGETINKRLQKLKPDVLYHDRLDLDTPILFSFLGTRRMKDFDCAVVGEMVAVNSTWLRLGLAFNKITTTGLKYICKGLRRNNTLTELLLSDNKITRLDALVDALKGNRILQYIDLEHNDLGDLAAGSVAELIETNKTIRGINVARNVFTNDGAARIAEALKTNNTLLQLNVNGHESMTKKGRNLLKAAVKGKRIKLKCGKF